MTDVSGATTLLLHDAAIPASKVDDPAKAHQAAQQFEALLLEQVLQAAKGNTGWLQTDGDGEQDCAMGLAEQQLAISMARNGGFGLANLIDKALETR